MRPIVRGPRPKDTNGADVVFADYKQARDHLIGRIGDYCSYCEVCLHGPIAVEHVRPKKPQPALALEWTNFLLACDNCNSVKLDSEINLNDYFWPDRDNTATVFSYVLDQPPQVATSLDPALHQTASRTLQLTGLDRVPGHPDLSERDRRWHKRREAWGVALQARKNLARNDTYEMRELILHTAVSRGFWSVWFQVFHDDPDMRKRLIEWFPGTCRECFDVETRCKRRAGGLA
jgi:uncharacterized protein (TIGR02646 family)